MDKRLYDEDGNTVLHLATYANQYQMDITAVSEINNINASSSEFREMDSLAQSLQRGGSSDQHAAGYNASAISEMNNINASSSAVDIREMNSLAQSPQRGGSSDQQAAVVPIITASNGRRNEEQQQQIVDIHSSHGAGDHSSDKAKDDDKWQDSVAGPIKNGILLVCSFFATFCLEAILNLPGGIEWEQLQSKPMNNITVDRLQRLQYFLSSVISCFFLSLMTIYWVTASTFHYKHLLPVTSYMVAALVISATILFHDGLVLATNDSLAHAAFKMGFRKLFVVMAGLIILALLVNKEFRSIIRKEYSKIRDLITKLLCHVLSWITRQ